MSPVAMNSILDDEKLTKFGERYLLGQSQSLIHFAQGSVLPTGGFGYLDSAGKVDLTKPLEAYINCRMTQVFGLGYLLGISDTKKLVEHGVNALLDLFEDKENGGFFNKVAHDGTPMNTQKLAYDQMFILLAASTARAIGVARADELFSKIDRIIDEKYWDEKNSLMHNEWNQSFTKLDSYHGINANMHAVEALCAAFEVSGNKKFRDRAYAISHKAINVFAKGNSWLLPEHFDENWNVIKDYNIDHPADPFCPFGVTIGHLLEWSRLILQLKLIAPEGEDLSWIDIGAKNLYEIARKYGWHADGSDGFIYTMDWEKNPVVTARMHWVVAEAVMTAYTLWIFTGEDSYLKDYERWWSYIDAHVLDKDLGSWKHELDAEQQVVTQTWPGKPDAYHAFNACILGMYPMRTSFVGSAILGS